MGSTPASPGSPTHDCVTREQWTVTLVGSLYELPRSLNHVAKLPYPK